MTPSLTPARAGELVQAFAPLFPAATAYTTPACADAWFAYLRSGAVATHDKNSGLYVWPVRSPLS